MTMFLQSDKCNI